MATFTKQIKDVNLKLAVRRACSDINEFSNFKTNYPEKMSDDMLLLGFLESELGFSLNDFGTILFRDVLLKAMDYKNYVDVIQCTEDKYNYYKDILCDLSSFYINLSYNERKLRLNDFHKFISDAISNINIDSSSKLSDMKAKMKDSNYHYGVFVLDIVDYIKENDALRNNAKKASVTTIGKSRVRSLKIG